MTDDKSAEVYLSDISDRDKPWDAHKAHSVLVQGIYRDSELSRLADRMQQCANWLDYVLKADDAGELKLRLTEARFCRIRFCPVCQWRRSLMWQARFHQMLPKLLADQPSARFIFLTLTVRNCAIAELRDTITAMNSAWDRLSRRKIFPATGWVRSLEITRNAQDGSAHPHFHVLMMVKPSYFKGKGYIKHEQWREMWRDALRIEYLPIVNVKTVSASAKHRADDEKSALTSAIVETLKYGVKEPDLLADQEWLIELTQQLHGLRSIAVGGLMRKYIKADEPENLINTDEPESDLVALEDDQHLIFEWKQIVQRYAQKK